MNTMDEPKRGPGRPRKDEMERDRQEATQRRRKSRAGVIGKRLPVNESQVDFDKFAYRWINDDPARIFAKTQDDDWTIVRQDGGEVTGEDDLGGAVRRVVATNTDGSPKWAYLARKPKPFYAEDQQEKMAELDRQLEQMRRGNDAAGAPLGDYVPSGGINI